DPHARPMDAGEVAARLGAMGTPAAIHPAPLPQPPAGPARRPAAAEFDDFALPAPNHRASGPTAFDDFALRPAYGPPASPAPQASALAPPSSPWARPSREAATEVKPPVVETPVRKPAPNEQATSTAPPMQVDMTDPERTQAIPGTHMAAATVSVPRATVVDADRAGPVGRAAAAGRPTGQPVLVFRSAQGPRGMTGGAVSMAAAAALGLGVLVAMIMLLNRPDEPPTPSTPVSIGAASAQQEESQPIEVTLSEPVDRGDFVQLNWDSSTPLEYAVIVAGDGEKAKALIAHGKNSLRVQVDPERGYCFAVQGTDGSRVYESDPRPIRGASCAE
ncbi:MAG: hypothetical protein ACRDQB_00490, partial [Thermocrispum sp.]